MPETTTVARRPLLALALATSLAGPAAAGIVDIPGYQGIRVWEATYVLAHEASFEAGDARLTSVLAGSALTQSGRDFGFFNGNENYDLYLSDASGKLDPHGSYLTIDGNCDVASNCFNISEAAVRVNGSNLLSSGVVRAVYGRAGSFTPNSAGLAADGNFSSYTQLGDTIGGDPSDRMSITLGFANVPAVPEPGTWVLMLAGLAGLGRLAARRRG